MPNPLGHALRNRRAGQHTLAWARPDMQADETFALTSPAFENGTRIPSAHRGRLFGANISPALGAMAGHLIGRARLDGTYEIE